MRVFSPPVRLVSSMQRRRPARAAHPSRVRVPVNRCPPARRWRRRVNPPSAIDYFRCPQTADARNIGSGSAHSSPSPASARRQDLARRPKTTKQSEVQLPFQAGEHSSKRHRPSRTTGLHGCTVSSRSSESPDWSAHNRGRHNSLNDGALPFEMAVGLEIIGRVQDGQNQLHQFSINVLLPCHVLDVLRDLRITSIARPVGAITSLRTAWLCGNIGTRRRSRN